MFLFYSKITWPQHGRKDPGPKLLDITKNLQTTDPNIFLCAWTSLFTTFPRRDIIMSASAVTQIKIWVIAANRSNATAEQAIF